MCSKLSIQYENTDYVFGERWQQQQQQTAAVATSKAWSDDACTRPLS
jgi:hypothetical protein